LLLDHASQPFHRALNEVERGDGYALKSCALRHPGAKDFGGPAGGALKPLF
jgi:hypothetical protein